MLLHLKSHMLLAGKTFLLLSDLWRVKEDPDGAEGDVAWESRCLIEVSLRRNVVNFLVKRLTGDLLMHAA